MQARTRTRRPATRRLSLGSLLLAALALPIMLVTLLGLERLTVLPDGINVAFSGISQLFVQLVAVTAAIAVVIGVLNLFNVHLRNLGQFPRGIYSLITLITLVVVVVLHVLERGEVLKVQGEGPNLTLTIMDAVQVVIESALAGLLFFFLVFAAYRLLRHRATIWGALFVGALTIVLIGYSPLTGLEFLSGLRDWVLRVPVNAGTRGLLIGVAIGTIAVGVRVLVSQDRTFRE